MKNTCILFCILLLISAVVKPLGLYSQEDTVFRSSMRIGFDVSYPVRTFWEPEVEQYEVSVDYEMIENIFGVVEAGKLDVNIERDDFDYLSDGLFFRMGADFNVLGDATLKGNDIVYVGIRYGYCSQKHRADNIILTDDYWGIYKTSVDNFEFDVHWGELLVGMKTELFANIFIGWSLRFRLVLSGAEDSLMKPYRIGGFGGGGKSTTFDFNYSVFYRIPF